MRSVQRSITGCKLLITFKELKWHSYYIRFLSAIWRTRSKNLSVSLSTVTFFPRVRFQSTLVLTLTALSSTFLTWPTSKFTEWLRQWTLPQGPGTWYPVLRWWRSHSSTAGGSLGRAPSCRGHTPRNGCSGPSIRIAPRTRAPPSGDGAERRKPQ